MKRKTADSGLRKHRPAKKFRFEYLKGKYTGMTKKEREARLFSEIEQEEDGQKEMRESLANYRKEKNGIFLKSAHQTNSNLVTD